MLKCVQNPSDNCTIVFNVTLSRVLVCMFVRDYLVLFGLQTTYSYTLAMFTSIASVLIILVIITNHYQHYEHYQKLLLFGELLTHRMFVFLVNVIANLESGKHL